RERGALGWEEGWVAADGVGDPGRPGAEVAKDLVAALPAAALVVGQRHDPDVEAGEIGGLALEPPWPLLEPLRRVRESRPDSDEARPHPLPVQPSEDLEPGIRVRGRPRRAHPPDGRGL